MDLLYYILGGLGFGLAGMLLVPPGPAILAAGFALVRDSKLARWCVVALAVLVAIGKMRSDARKQGAADAHRDVEAANRRALEKRAEIDRQAGAAAEQTIRDELKRWSR